MSGLVPPLTLCHRVGSPTQLSFKSVGEETLRLLRELGGLKPTDRLLEVGCGCGRVAIPLTGYLTSGSYDGFDVDSELIEWASGEITSKNANFRFRHVDLYNDFYNPAGKEKADRFVFPYEAGRFDFVVLNSVFTHLVYADVRRYLAEMSRTAKPGARVLMSFFILNDQAERALKTGAGKIDFAHRLRRGVRVQNKERHSSAIAYPEPLLRELVADGGFAIEEPVRFGKWSGRQDGLSFQDYIVARKIGAPKTPALWRRLLHLD